MAGIGKRPATYVPKWCRAEIEKLSKADLMEIAYDFAMRAVGEDSGEVAAYKELRQTALILARCASRREPRLEDAAALATARNHVEVRGDVALVADAIYDAGDAE